MSLLNLCYVKMRDTLICIVYSATKDIYSVSYILLVCAVGN